MNWFRKPCPANEPDRRVLDQKAIAKERAEAAAARKRADAALEASQERWPEVRRVSESLASLQERNHFAASVRMIFQGGHPDGI